MGWLLFLARVRVPAPDEGAEPLAVAPRSGLGPGATSQAQAGALLGAASRSHGIPGLGVSFSGRVLASIIRNSFTFGRIASALRTG